MLDTRWGQLSFRTKPGLYLVPRSCPLAVGLQGLSAVTPARSQASQAAHASHPQELNS